MRKLEFSENHKLTFKHLYFGFVQGGNNLNKDTKPRSLVRLEARIHDKLEAISEEDKDDPNLPLKLKNGPQVLLLTTEEYQHIDKCIDAVAWPTVGAKHIAIMLDFWDEALKVEG